MKSEDMESEENNKLLTKNLEINLYKLSISPYWDKKV